MDLTLAGMEEKAACALHTGDRIIALDRYDSAWASASCFELSRACGTVTMVNASNAKPHFIEDLVALHTWSADHRDTLEMQCLRLDLVHRNVSAMVRRIKVPGFGLSLLAADFSQGLLVYLETDDDYIANASGE